MEMSGYLHAPEPGWTFGRTEKSRANAGVGCHGHPARSPDTIMTELTRFPSRNLILTKVGRHVCKIKCPHMRRRLIQLSYVVTQS
jgi:hypothetical protein